jgi:hypothetical protein
LIAAHAAERSVRLAKRTLRGHQRRHPTKPGTLLEHTVMADPIVTQHAPLISGACKARS